MADISVIIEVLGNKDIERATKSMSSLEGRVDTLRKALKQGRISEDQFKQGLKEIRRSVDSQFPSWQKAKAAIDNYRKSLDRMEQSKAVEQATQDYRRLAAAIDPVERITQEYQRSVRTLDNALENNVITLDEYNRRLATVKGNMEKAGVTFNQYGQVANVNTRRLKRFSAVGLQQVGYQLGDFAVQVQSGTNVAVAFGQQMSQLLGIFGPAGAIAGAAVAITTAFVAPLLDAKKAAEDFETSLESMSTAISSAKQALDLHKMSVVELADKYGLLALEAKEASIAIAEADFRDAVSSIRSGTIPVLEELEEAFSRISDKGPTATTNTIQRLKKDFKELSDSMGLNVSSSEELVSAFRKFQSSRGIDQQLSAAIDLRDAMSKIPNEVLEADKELNNAVKSINSLFLEGSELKQLMSELEDSTPGSGWMDSAIKGVNSLYNRIVAAISGVKELKSGAGKQFGEGPPLVYDPLSGRYVESGQGGRSNLATNMGLDLGTGTLGSSGKIGSSGGGTSPAEKQAQEFNKARDALAGLMSKYDEGVAVAEKLRDAQITVNEAVRVGVISANQGQQAMQGYIESLEQADSPIKKIGQTIKDSLGGALMSIVDGSKSAGDAFKDMARIILKQAFELMVIKPILDGLFGQNPSENGIGGLVGSILGQKNGGAWHNGVQMYANGGVVGSPTAFQHKGGLGVMGEAGPEAIMPLKRGKNGKLGVQTEGGSQGNVTVENHFHIAANGDESVRKIIAQEAPRIASLTQKQILDQRARGGAFKTTFG